MKYTYLLLNIFTILFPLLWSFESKVHYAKKWKYLFPSIILIGGIFITWDVWFTNIRIWSFNPKYLTGITIVNLPIEEWLFFLTVPFSCTFIFEVVQYSSNSDKYKSAEKWISAILVVLLTILSVFFHEKLYTFVTFLSTAIVLSLIQWFFKWKKLNLFYIAYLFCLIPFFIVNGILTAFPVVIYNNAENLNIRIGSIPVEDSIYGFLLLLLVAFVYDKLSKIKIN